MANWEFKNKMIQASVVPFQALSQNMVQKETTNPFTKTHRPRLCQRLGFQCVPDRSKRKCWGEITSIPRFFFKATHVYGFHDIWRCSAQRNSSMLFGWLTTHQPTWARVLQTPWLEGILFMASDTANGVLNQSCRPKQGACGKKTKAAACSSHLTSSHHNLKYGEASW